ncbi:MAG TPA: T9SS type A sorting domain-containing protein, partial [Flavisolibacter sp.]|nr:T9SS type A sorting domain-containing protein [Flavisolibacter sp.]
ERSMDGIRFTPVLSLQAKGGEGRNAYSATDPAAGSATLYYRIKQVDADGKFSYSNVLRLVINGTPALKLLQNPIQNQLGFECSEEWLGGRFEITDASGRTVYKGEVTTTINQVTLKASSSGIWYLTVYSKTGGQRVSLPFVCL